MDIMHCHFWKLKQNCMMLQMGMINRLGTRSLGMIASLRQMWQDLLVALTQTCHQARECMSHLQTKHGCKNMTEKKYKC